jgi:hypothetical protein
METGETTMTNEQKASAVTTAFAQIVDDTNAGGDYETSVRLNMARSRVLELSDEQRARLFDLITQDVLATA